VRRSEFDLWMAHFRGMREMDIDSIAEDVFAELTAAA
jgi:hypothetical protein